MLVIMFGVFMLNFVAFSDRKAPLDKPDRGGNFRHDTATRHDPTRK